MNPERAELLHNMSAPPKTVVQFEGLRALQGLGAAKDHPPALHGTPFRFCIDATLLELKPARLLQTLDPSSRVRVHAIAEKRLLQLVEQHAQTLPLPEGCLIVKSSSRHAVAWPDALTALAVLTKCTDTVWLRAKSPSLEVARARLDVSLLVPPAFVYRISVTTAQEPDHG